MNGAHSNHQEQVGRRMKQPPTLPSLDAVRTESSSEVTVRRTFARPRPWHEDTEAEAELETKVNKETLLAAWLALVPKLEVELTSVCAARMVPVKSGKLLARVDGSSSLSTIIESEGLPREEGVQLFRELEARGIIRVH